MNSFAIGGFTVSISWENGTLLEASIVASRTCRHTVYYGEEQRVIDFVAGEACIFQPLSERERVAVPPVSCHGGCHQ